MKFITLFSAIIGLSSPALSKNCVYQEIQPKKRESALGIYKINSTTELHVENGHPTDNVFEGPAIIHENGKKKCLIEGGIFSNFFLSSTKTHLIAVEYSGSCHSQKLVDITSCQISQLDQPKCHKVKQKGRKLSSRFPCNKTNTTF